MIVIFCVFLMGACAPATTGIEASDVWARTGTLGGNGAIYMVLANSTSVDDELLSASSEISRAVELHESKLGGNGEMQMVPQVSILLAAGTKAEFKPGGLHIMLIGLKQDLKVGDQFELTLHFKKHADMVLTVNVQEGMDMGM